MSWIPVFSVAELQWSYCGFSVYQGIIVSWDEDFDQRILVWIDSLDAQTRCCLYAASESKGCLHLKWRSGPIPNCFKADEQIETFNDVWIIVESEEVSSQAMIMLPAADYVTRSKVIS